MFTFLIIILFCTLPPRGTPYSGPRRPPWTHWVVKIAAVHLVNMTEELLKDMAYKLKHAEKIRDSHGISLPFLLGSVAAGVQERFYRMLKLYRKYANMRDFKAQRWGGRDLMNAYHIIQGDYNEIRHEKDLYLQIVRRYESTSKPPQHNFTTRPFGRRAQTWRPTGHAQP